MKTATFALLAVFALPAHATEAFCGSGKPHAIDVESDARMDKALTTADMRDVQGWTYDAWDKELNRVYAGLAKGLDNDSAAKLQAAQRAWIKFRDSEVEWLRSTAMYGDSGTSGPLNVAGASTALVRQRTCELTRSLQARDASGQ